MGKKPNTPEKIWSLIAQENGEDSCWLWLGHFNKQGYATVRFQGKTEYVHRLILEWTSDVSRKEAGERFLETRHLCGNMKCQNPKHLSWGSSLENCMDRARHGGDGHWIGARKARIIKGLYASLRRYPRSGMVVRDGLSRVARLMGVSRQTVYQIGTGRTRGGV